MWFPLTLATALFTSLTDVFSRKIIRKVDVIVIAWGWAFFSLPLLYLSLWFAPPAGIGPHFIPALAVTTLNLTVANVLYFKAIRVSDLSEAVPMLTFTPLFMLMTSPLILREMPRPLGIIGILLIVGGSYILHFNDRRRGYMAPFKHLVAAPGARYMLMVAFLYSIGANIDKIGVLNSSPMAWGAAVNTALAASLGVVMGRKIRHPLRQIRSVWICLLLIGMSIALAIICQMTAIRMTLVPYVIAVKRTSVILTSLFGFLIFRESGIRERLTGVLIMLLGVFLIYVFQ